MEQMLQYILVDEKKKELTAEYGIPRSSMISTEHFAITKGLSIPQAGEFPFAVHVSLYNSVCVHQALHVMRKRTIVVSKLGHA